MKAILPVVLAVAFASPALAQDEPSWNLSLEGDAAYLSYAIPDSDDGGPMFSCRPGDGLVKVSLLVERRLATDTPRPDGTWVDANGHPPPWRGKLTLVSSSVTGVFQAAVHPEEMYGGSIVEARLSVDEPVLVSFGGGGLIKLSSFDETTTPPPAPREKVRALLRACAK